MNIIISNSSVLPIYAQIVEQVKKLIIAGKLTEEEPLPSMRLLAKELRISVITTKRAYEELEREGFITSIPGRGSFVAPKNLELIKEQHLRDIEEKLQEVCHAARLSGITLEELDEMLHIAFEE